MPAVTCSLSSPQCCWVVRILQLMGKSDLVDHTSATACCRINGVTCSGSTVTKIYWGWRGITGSIPPEIGNLVNLTYLHLGENQLNGSIPSEIGNLTSLQTLNLNKNQLTGPIPAEIGHLVNLKELKLLYNQLSGPIPDFGSLVNMRWLSFENNQGLNGTLTLPCIKNVFIEVESTNIVVCGCESTFTPPAIFPPPGTPDSCLASSSATSLQKRTQIFSSVIGSYQYTCNLDSDKNPYQDCLNTMVKICKPDYMGTNITLISECKIGINQMVNSMSPLWKNVRKACGQWKWIDGTIGNVNSLECTNANAALQSQAFYDGIPVSSLFIYSVNLRLWSNSNLQE